MNPTRTKRIEQELPCDLTDEERLVFADHMAKASNQIDLLLSERRQFLASNTLALKEARAEHARLANIVGSRSEIRQVPVEVQYDFQNGRMRFTRLDTNVAFEERPMNDEERQLSLLEDQEQQPY